MLRLNTFEDFRSYCGQQLGVSRWKQIGENDIMSFAEITGDRQWIHIDGSRAKAELPGGMTIVHGYLLLSLLPSLMEDIFSIGDEPIILNYGADRIRFTSPVPSGSKIQLTLSVVDFVRKGTGMSVTMASEINTLGGVRPVMIADTILFCMDK